MSSIGVWIRRIPVWLRVVIALFVPVAAFGIYVRFAALPDVFCKSPDELAEMMPGLRLHALPILNIRDALRYNFIQSMFYSQHGLGDVSFHYLSSGLLSLLGLPISERFLFSAAGITNLALALAGGVLGASLLGSAGTGWVFAVVVMLSPFYVFVSRTGWGRLTWTPLLLVMLFLSQWMALRKRGVRWSAAFVILAGFISLTDGVVFLPLVGVLALLATDGPLTGRVRQLARDRVLLVAIGAIVVGLALDLVVGLEARRRGTNLTLLAYLMLKGTNNTLVPSRLALAGWAQAVDGYFPFRGAWTVVTTAFILACVDGLRGRRIGFVAAWWLLAAIGVLRYASGQDPNPSWLNAYILTVPSFLLLAWLIASIAEGRLPLLPRFPRPIGGTCALAMLLGLASQMALQANAVAFSVTASHGVAGHQLASNVAPRLGACRALKAAAFYVRSHAVRPYVFHLSSDVHLGHIGEFYYGLSYGRSLRPEEPNHLLDFGFNQFQRRYPPEAFYQPYGVAQFDYYVSFADDRDTFATQAMSRLLDEGARVVCTIWDDGRTLGQILSFHLEPAIDLDYRTAARSWDQTFARSRTLLQQPVAGTAYHFGYNWRSPE